MKRSIQTTLLPLAATTLFAGLALLVMLEIKESQQLQEQIKTARITTIIVMAISLIALVWVAIKEISKRNMHPSSNPENGMAHFTYRRNPEGNTNKQLDLFAAGKIQERFFIATGSRPSDN